MHQPKTVFMFSGQGSQTYQMAKALFEHQAVFRESMEAMDAQVVKLGGHSVLEALYAPSHTKTMRFERTLLTHPAIFMVEYALAQTLIVLGLRPDLVLGTSLGAFAAATVAGCLDLDTALIAVMRHAKLMEARCPPGGMIAIFDAPALYAQTPLLQQHCAIAGINFDSHFIVAGDAAGLQQVEAYLAERQIMYQRLPVTFAFHSEWIDNAAAPYIDFLHTLPLRAPVIPIACCAERKILERLPADYFWTVARQPIYFEQTIAQIDGLGPFDYVDLGPSSTLAAFLKYALPPDSRSRRHSILKTVGKDLDSLAALLRLLVMDRLAAPEHQAVD